ncbi:hypothetical protein AK812_SmicGene46283, partial [Symbiodinium microadriaticum]
VFEHKLALLHEDWEAQAKSMQQVALALGFVWVYP